MGKAKHVCATGPGTTRVKIVNGKSISGQIDIDREAHAEAKGDEGGLYALEAKVRRL